MWIDNTKIVYILFQMYYYSYIVEICDYFIILRIKLRIRIALQTPQILKKRIIKNSVGQSNAL